MNEVVVGDVASSADVHNAVDRDHVARLAPSDASTVHIDADRLAVVSRTAAGAVAACAHGELIAAQCAELVHAAPALAAEVTELRALARRCGYALERWCSATDRAVQDFMAVDAGLVVAAALSDRPPRNASLLGWPVTHVAPYLDDAGHIARYAGVVAGEVSGLDPTSAYVLTTVPGRLAHGVARVLPEGDGRAIPAGASALPARTTTSVGGWLQTVAALPAGTIGVTDLGGAWVVSLPGIHSLGDSRDPMDLYGAVRGLFGGTSAYPKAVEKALDLACVPVGASVMLVGHSQGGITAMDLAADRAFNGRRVRVTHVVTAGSPVSGMHPAAGSGTHVLELDNDDDLVPQLDLRDSRRGTADHRVVAIFRYDDGTVGGDHGLATAYVPFTDSGAFLAAPGVTGWLRSAARYLTGGSAQQQRFALRDR